MTQPPSVNRANRFHADKQVSQHDILIIGMGTEEVLRVIDGGTDWIFGKVPHNTTGYTNEKWISPVWRFKKQTHRLPLHLMVIMDMFKECNGATMTEKDFDLTAWLLVLFGSDDSATISPLMREVIDLDKVAPQVWAFFDSQKRS